MPRKPEIEALTASEKRHLTQTTNFVVARFGGPCRSKIEPLEGSVEPHLTLTTNFVVACF